MGVISKTDPATHPVCQLDQIQNPNAALAPAPSPNRPDARSQQPAERSPRLPWPQEPREEQQQQQPPVDGRSTHRPVGATPTAAPGASRLTTL